MNVKELVEKIGKEKAALELGLSLAEIDFIIAVETGQIASDVAEDRNAQAQTA